MKSEISIKYPRQTGESFRYSVLTRVDDVLVGSLVRLKAQVPNDDREKLELSIETYILGATMLECALNYLLRYAIDAATLNANDKRCALEFFSAVERYPFGQKIGLMAKLHDCKIDISERGRRIGKLLETRNYLVHFKSKHEDVPLDVLSLDFSDVHTNPMSLISQLQSKLPNQQWVTEMLGLDFVSLIDEFIDHSKWLEETFPAIRPVSTSAPNGQKA
jgi:hypothetical protein